MKNLDNVISEYLKKQTNYALMITGKWGVGKTYYYKNHLSKSIKAIGSLENDSVKYKSIHISLFGLSSIEDIQTQIFLSLHPFLKNKVVKLSVGLGKSLARGILSLKNLGNIDDYISDVKPETGDWIKLSELVICFDDLERKSSKLPIEELIGYINSLVENNDAKIILIANNDKIEDSGYNDLKEKVIGITVDYIPDFRKNLLNIINERYSSSFKIYAEFLNNHIDLILSYAKKFDNNLRVLIFILDKLHTIYSTIKTDFLDLPVNKGHILNDKLIDIVKFTLATSIEYKRNSITFANRNEIDKSGVLDINDIELINTLIIGNKKYATNKKEEKSFRQIFIESYFQNQSDYHFFESIYTYVTGADKFFIDNLIIDLNKAYHLHKENMLPQYEVLNTLNYRNCYSLSDKEYKSLTNKMVAFAEKGKYEFGDYLTVFHFAIRFDNLLNYNIDNLKKRIKQGIKKAQKTQPHAHSLDFYLDIPIKSKYKKELEEIKIKVLKCNEEVLQKKDETDGKEMIVQLSENWTNFRNKMLDSKEVWHFTPIFKYTTGYKAYVIINRFNLFEIKEFSDLIRHRYREHTHPELKEELAFLKEFEIKLDPTSQVRLKKNLKNNLLNLLHSNVQLAIKHIDK